MLTCALLLLLTVTGGLLRQGSGDAKIAAADSSYHQYRRSDDPRLAKQAAAQLDELAASSSSYDVRWRQARIYYSIADDTKVTSEKQKVFERSIEFGKMAVAARPEGVEGHYWLGVAYGGYGEAKGMLKAISSIDTIRKEMAEVIRLNPGYENAGAYLVIGRIDFELPRIFGGNKKRAIQEYEQGLKISPGNPLMKVYLADSYIDADRKPEAKKLLEEVLAIKPGAEFIPELKDAQKEGRKLYDQNFSK